MSNERCLECRSTRLIEISAPLGESCTVLIGDAEYTGSLPDDLNVGDSSMLSLIYCGDCGQIQDDFPLDKTQIETEAEEENE